MPDPIDELAPDAEPRALLERGDAFLRAASAIEAALPVAAFFALAQEELREAFSRRVEACKRSEEAYRACDDADRRLDRAIGDLSLATLALAGDTGAPMFTRLFPEGPQAYVFAPIDRELQLVRELRERLEGHPLEARFAPLIEADSRAVAEAERRLAAALDEEAAAWARTRKAEMAWRLRSRLARKALERALREAGHPELLPPLDRLLAPAEPAPSGTAPVSSRREH